MQHTRFAMHEERHRHAPLALTGQRPVGTIGDHGVQACFAPGWEELGCVHGFKRRLTQRFAARFWRYIHPRKPLIGRPIDDRRAVPPAVHVAVCEFLGLEQRALAAHVLDDFRVCVPDRQTTEFRQRFRVFAIVHHGRQHVSVFHAIRAARQKVFDAVGRRRMHDTCAGVERDVFRQIDRRKAFIKRMRECDVI